MLALFLLSCAVDLAGFDTGQVPAGPTYADDVEPLLAEHCVRCHDQGGRMDAGVPLDTYDGARSNRVRLACTAVGSDVVAAFAQALLLRPDDDAPCVDQAPLSMPPGAMPRLTLTEQLTVARWVAQGALP